MVQDLIIDVLERYGAGNIYRYIKKDGYIGFLYEQGEFNQQGFDEDYKSFYDSLDNKDIKDKDIYNLIMLETLVITAVKNKSDICITFHDDGIHIDSYKFCQVLQGVDDASKR